MSGDGQAMELRDYRNLDEEQAMDQILRTQFLRPRPITSINRPECKRGQAAQE